MNPDTSQRDRDDTGRPHNARARDALGRPLPPGSVGVPRIPEDLFLPAVETLSYAQDLLDGGLAFNAHEVLEAAWKTGPDDERTLWQSLAQLAVGVTHLQRCNTAGAAALLQRGRDGLAGVDRPAPHRIDIDGLIAWASTLVEDLTAGAAIDMARLRPQLRTIP